MDLPRPARTLYGRVSVTLRLKLFVLIGGLLALMVGAEWLLIETLTKDLRVEVTAVATSVGKDIVRILHRVDEKGPDPAAPAGGVRKVVVHDETNRTLAEALGRLTVPTAMGVLYRKPRAVYETAVRSQLDAAKAKGIPDLKKALAGKNTWTVG